MNRPHFSKLFIMTHRHRILPAMQQHRVASLFKVTINGMAQTVYLSINAGKMANPALMDPLTNKPIPPKTILTFGRPR